MAPAPTKPVPFDITEVTAEEDKLIKKCIKGHMNRFVKCGKPGYVMPGAFKKHAEAIYNLKVRPDDVWVITFPRSGTTWTQEMVWLLQNDLNYELANTTPLHERFPMLETTAQVPAIGLELIKFNFMNLGNFQGLDKAVRKPSWKIIDEAPSPRFIKTHMPLSLLPPDLLNTAKVVYVGRDPRDVVVSYYYLIKMFTKNLFRVRFKNFWEAFRRDLLPWTPIIAHTNEAWTNRFHPNLHFVFFEDMKKDLPKEIRNVSNFLGKQYTDQQIDALSKHLSFDSLKKNKNVNNTFRKQKGVEFLRKGESGGWRDRFDKEMEVQAEEFLSSRLQGLDIEYPSIPSTRKS